MTPEEQSERAGRLADRLVELAGLLGVEKVVSVVALLRIRQLGSLNFTELSKIMGVSVAAGSVTIWSWHDKGLVHAERPARRSAQDQRSVLVQLTAGTAEKIGKFLSSELELDENGNAG